MGGADREIRAIAPKVRILPTGRSVADGDAGGDGFAEGYAEGDVLIGGGIRVTDVIFPMRM